MAVIYVAKPGDSLSRILQRAGGSWLREEWRNRLMQINPHINDPNRIEINQLILVPESPNEIVLQDQVDYVSRVRNASNDGFLRKEIERFAQQREEAARRQQFFQKLDRINELTGAGIIYSDKSGKPITIRNPIGNKKKTIVIRDDSTANSNDPVNERIVSELTGTVLACTAGVLGVIAIFGSSALIPVSGGASTALTYLAISATGASLAQCGIGAFRVYRLSKGDVETVDWLDSQEWFIYTSITLDSISVAGGVSTTAIGIRALFAMKKAAPGKSIFDLLKGLQRHERKRLTEELIRLQNPGISNKALKEMIRTGMVPKRFKQTVINQSLRTQVIDLFGAGASLLGSGLSGVVNMTGSKVSILLFEPVED